MKVEEVKECSFERWYESFKAVTIRSIIIPIPDEFVSFILEDRVVLPEDSLLYSAQKSTESSDSEEETDWDDAETTELKAPHFSEFDKKIKDAIERLGGKVFPKLNWSSPRDASWIGLNSSCCCTHVSDVYTLLQSSDFIIHDLTERFKLCEDLDLYSSTNLTQEYFLILRRWTDIDTSGEFRCFVKDNKLIGICQREHSVFYDHILPHREEILEDIITFFKVHIHSRFSCSSYVVDVYRKRKGKVYLIDFNPFGTVTDSLLFNWEDLKNESFTTEDEFPQFKFVEDNFGVQPSTLSYHAVPKDIVDMVSGNDSFKLVDFMKLVEQQKNGASDESEEEWKV